MFGAAREKTRLWLLILVGVVATLVGQTHAREIFAPTEPAPAKIAAFSPATTGDFYDACRYDVPDSLLAAKSAVPTIGGRLPINSKYAGQVHPSGIPFTEQGFPNFSSVSKAEVQLQGLTGNYAKDAAMANQAVGLSKTPSSFVWHHVEDGATMQLVPREIHNATRHTGGAAVIRNGGFDP